MNIRRIIKEEIDGFDFDWVEEHEYSHEELVKYIKDDNITEWTFGEEWKGDLDLRGTPIQSLGNLESVGGSLDLTGTKIHSLGNLKSVGGDLSLYGIQIQDLGNLESVGGGLNLYGTKIQSLGNLESVDGNLYLRKTPISKKYSEQEIREMVLVDGEIYL